MKKLCLVSVLALGATMYAPAQTQESPLPLAPGHVTVDFGSAQSVYYTYTPQTDQMLQFGNLSNVNIYTYQVTPTDKRYGESFNQVSYIQTQAGVTYSIEVAKGWSSAESSFDLEVYNCPWPDGDSWEKAIEPFERFCYVPVTANQPVYLKYTPDSDGVLSMLFNSSVTISYSTASDGEFTPVKTSYQTGGGYKGLLDVTGGQTYYFTAKAYGSFLCGFELLHPVVGTSPDFPYTVNAGTPAEFPKEAGEYYYKIVNNGSNSYLLLEGTETFSGKAQAGTSFSYFSDESADSIHIRMSVSSSYNEYCLKLTRDIAAEADQTFSATYSEEPYDMFPGQAVTAGEYTTPDFGGLYYYTFTVPDDGRDIIVISAQGSGLDSETSASLYYADNQYSTLARGAEIEYEAVAGRAYVVSWRVSAADAPLTFSVGFKAPAVGESPSNPFIARLGENSGKGAEQVYFKYTATLDGWLYITPAEGTPVPAVSMLPIPTDPYTQACEVIADGDSYRVSCTKDRGYLVVFNTAETAAFNLAEYDALEGESASNPFAVTDGKAAVPEAVGTYWFRYTAPRDGKLVVSTNLPYEVSENRQDYTFVRLYLPSDPDNFIAELRPDHDNGVFVDKILDTTEGAEYLVKVRTMEALAGCEVTFVVRDPVDGEIPGLPIVIPFEGVSATYTFDRVVNSEADALWYSLSFPEGSFTIAGSSSETFNMDMYLPSDLERPVASVGQLGVRYDEEQEIYIYIWGIDNIQVASPTTYLLHVTYNPVPFTVGINKTSGIGTIESDRPADAGARWFDLRGVRLPSAPTAPGLYILDGRKVIVR